MEILVVLAIIGLLVGLIGPQLMQTLGGAKEKTARIQIEQLGSALDIFYLDAGRYPTAQEGLAALITRPSDVAQWAGPYLKGGKVPTDPWGNPYIYRAPGQNGPYEVRSRGAKGNEEIGGSDASANIPR